MTGSPLLSPLSVLQRPSACRVLPRPVHMRPWCLSREDSRPVGAGPALPTSCGLGHPSPKTAPGGRGLHPVKSKGTACPPVTRSSRWLESRLRFLVLVCSQVPGREARLKQGVDSVRRPPVHRPTARASSPISDPPGTLRGERGAGAPGGEAVCPATGQRAPGWRQWAEGHPGLSAGDGRQRRSHGPGGGLK